MMGKRKEKFFKSLRFRIMVILVVIGIIPSIIVENGIVNSYEDRAVKVRQATVKNQCDILSNQLVKEGYMESPEAETINSELTMLSNLYSGRVLIINRDFQIIKDTYDLDEGRIMISEEVVRCFRGEEISRYDDKNRFIEMTVSIRDLDTKEIQGVLLVSISADEITASIDILKQKGLAMLGGITVLVLIFGYILAGILVKPFARVTRAIEDLTDGYLDEEISVPDYTETELITDAFNKMLGRVKSLDASRQEFVSNVSHELKTPLTSMKVLADSLVGQENVPIELYQEFMQDITDEIDRENRIINDLLSLVKLDKKADLNAEMVSINDLLELILKRLRPIAAKRNIELILDSFRPVKAEIDETKLTLAISNADHKYFYVTVADSGKGIPEDSLDHIFERFYRVDKSHSTEIDGTGLGLAITRSAILMHHGAIKVYSKEGEGATFSVRIPLVCSN